MSEADEEIVGDEELYAPQVEEEVSWDSNFDTLSEEAIEKFARAQGWRPLSQYRGPPGGWQDARSFLKVGQDRLPVLRDNNHRMTEKIVRLENELVAVRTRGDEQMAVLQELREKARTADERGYKRAKAEIEARQTQAVEAGDAAGVRQTTEELVALETGHAEREPARAEPARRGPPPEPAEVTAFKRANPWFGPDRRLTNLMVVQDQANLDANPDMPLAERLEVSRAQVVKMAPECFPSEARAGSEAPRRQPARPLSPAARPGARSAAPAGEPGETIDSIADPVDRAEAKKAFARFKNVFGAKFTEAEYMKTYNDPHADMDVIGDGKPKAKGART